MDIKENAEVLFSKLENFFKTETVVGDPIKVDDIVIVPFITVTFGCGTGAGEGDNSGKKKDGEGSGLGAGARIVPNAVLVIKGEMIQMIPINNNKGNIDKLIELVPGLIEKFDKNRKEKKAKKEQEKNQL